MASFRKRAVENHRDRLGERGLARFEVVGRDADRDLIGMIAGEPPGEGGILAALRGSPLVGADLDLDRPSVEGGGVELRPATCWAPTSSAGSRSPLEPDER